MPNTRAATVASSDLMFWGRFALALLIATGLAFGIHVIYGHGWAAAYVDNAAHSGRLHGVLHEPYPASVVTIAYLTALFPMAGKVAVYVLLKDSLPGRSRIANGLWFGLLLMAMSDSLFRLPLMNLLIGNPFDVVFVQGLEGWSIDAATGIAVALLVPDFDRETRLSEKNQLA